MSNSKKDDLLPRIMKFIILWLLRMLWELIKTIWYRCQSHRMQIAPSREDVEKFYKSRKWYRLSLWAKNRYGRECMKCKKNPEAYPGLQLNTDHIRPVWYYWHLRRDPNNLQVLCARCNKAKGSVDMTDYRNYRPGKMPVPQGTPVPRRFQIAETHHSRERVWLS